MVQFKGDLNDDTVVRNIIRRNARRLRKSTRGYWRDEDDFTQDINLALLEYTPAYDSAKANPRTFANRIIKNCHADILERDRAVKRGFGFDHVSLDEEIKAEEEGQSSRHEFVGAEDVRSTWPMNTENCEQCRDLASDLRHVVEDLAPALRDLAHALQQSSPTGAADDLGISRSTLYERRGRLRQKCQEAGLEDYLVN